MIIFSNLTSICNGYYIGFFFIYSIFFWIGYNYFFIFFHILFKTRSLWINIWSSFIECAQQRPCYKWLCLLTFFELKGINKESGTDYYVKNLYFFEDIINLWLVMGKLRILSFLCISCSMSLKSFVLNRSFWNFVELNCLKKKLTTNVNDTVSY